MSAVSSLHYVSLSARSLESLEHISTKLMLADCLTKAMSGDDVAAALESSEIYLYEEGKIRGAHLLEKPVVRNDVSCLVSTLIELEKSRRRGANA